MYHSIQKTSYSIISSLSKSTKEAQELQEVQETSATVKREFSIISRGIEKLQNLQRNMDDMVLIVPELKTLLCRRLFWFKRKMYLRKNKWRKS